VIEVPLVELMCLARDKRWKGLGIGPTLMIEALRIVAEVADRIGTIGVHLRSTPSGERLYRDYGFREFKAHPTFDPARYNLSIRDVRAIAERARELIP